MDLTGPPISYYLNEEMSTAQYFIPQFAHGCGGHVHASRDLQPDYNVAIWGSIRLLKLMMDAFRQGRTIYYGDHAYFGRKRYYRVTKVTKSDAVQSPFPMQYIMHENSRKDYDQVRKMGIRQIPYHSGRNIIICPPSEGWCEFEGISRDAWIENVEKTLRPHTDLSFIHREKRSATPLQEHLMNAHAVVTHHSNVAVDAICYGVPAFVTSRCAALPVANTDLTKIMEPKFPTNEERFEWLATLVANQWTLEEINDGKCWRALELNQ